MGTFTLSSCSTVDLTKEYLQTRGIEYVCFHYELDGKHYRDDFGQTIPLQAFYQAMEHGAVTRTSQVNVLEYLEHFKRILQQGQDLLHVTLSSGISGSYQSALLAAAQLKEEFPERTIAVVDSLGASSGYGLLLDKLADLRDQGASLEETKRWAEEHRLELHHWFISTDLTYYVRGGRISKAAGFIGNVLNICPLMRVDSEGKLAIVSKVRTKKKAFKEMVARMQEHAQNGVHYTGKCFISQSACYEDAKQVAEWVEKAFPHLQGNVQIFDIGTTIGSHTGGGTIALFFWGDKRQ